jgi:hypothetical protein
MVPRRADPLATGSWFPLSRPSCFPCSRQLSSHHPGPLLQSGRRAWCLSQSHDGVGFTSRRRQWCLGLGRERSQSGPASVRLKHHAPPFQNALAPSPSPSLFSVSAPVSRNRRDFGKRKSESARFQVVGRRLPTCLLGPACQIILPKVALEEGTRPREGKRRFASRHDGMIRRSCALAGLTWGGRVETGNTEINRLIWFRSVMRLIITTFCIVWTGI